MKTQLALILSLALTTLAYGDSSKDVAGPARTKLPAQAPAELLLRTKDAPSTSKGEALRLQGKKTAAL